MGLQDDIDRDKAQRYASEQERRDAQRREYAEVEQAAGPAALDQITALGVPAAGLTTVATNIVRTEHIDRYEYLCRVTVTSRELRPAVLLRADMLVGYRPALRSSRRIEPAGVFIIEDGRERGVLRRLADLDGFTV